MAFATIAQAKKIYDARNASRPALEAYYKLYKQALGYMQSCVGHMPFNILETG